jgi:hypothetical protein
MASIAGILGYDSMFRHSSGVWRFDHRDGIRFTDLTAEGIAAALLAHIEKTTTP